MDEQKKKELFFYQMGAARIELLVIFILLESLMLFGIIESNASFDDFFLCSIPVFLVFVFSLLPRTPYNIHKLFSKIYISKDGLTCKVRNSVKWHYNWDEIDRFHQTNRYKNWWIDIYIQNKDTASASFQITPSTKTLIKQICPRTDLVAQMLSI